MWYGAILSAGGMAAAVWAAALLLHAGRAYEAVCLVLLAIGSSVSSMGAARRARGCRAFLTAAFAAALTVAVSGYLVGPLQSNAAYSIGMAVAGALFFHISATLPPSRRVSTLAVVAGYVLAAGALWRPALALALFAASQVAGILLWWDSFQQARRAGDVRVVRQTQILLMGPLIAWVPFVAFIPGLLPGDMELFLYGPAVLVPAILPFSMTAALVHPDMFDTGSILRRVLVSILLVAHSLLIYMGLVHLLAYLLVHLRPGAGPGAAVFGAALTVALLARPIERWMANQVDRLFFPDRIGFRTLLQEAGEALATTIMPQELERFATTVLAERLGASGAALLALDAMEQNLTPLSSDQPALPPDHPLRMANGGGNLRYVADTAQTLGLAAPALVIPLRAGARLVGLYLLGARVSGMRYTREELAQLRALGHHLAVAVENGRAYRRIEQLNQRALVEVEERNRLAREIHDTLAQGLASIGLQLDVVEATVAARPDRAEQAARRAHELVQASLAEARRSVTELRAPLLGAESLPEALLRATESAGAALGARAIFHIEGRYEPLPARVEMQLVRIAQEALHNAVKHSCARHVDVRLAISRDTVALIVADDGVGFDPAAPAVSGRFGLKGMAERAALAGGLLSVQSRPGGGARVEVSMPRGADEGHRTGEGVQP